MLAITVGVAGCGSSASSGDDGHKQQPGAIPIDAVAVVGGKEIAKSVFDHWLAVSAAHRFFVQYPKRSMKPVIPDPPRYTRCIATLRGVEAKSESGQPNARALESRCEQDYLAGKSEAMQFLITAEWLQREAASQHIDVSDREVSEDLRKRRAQEDPGEFAELLSRTGQSMADVMLKIKVGLLAHRLEGRALAKAKGPTSKAEVAAYYETHRSNYGHPAQRDVRIVITKDEATALKAKREIEAGTSYASVAEALSSLPDLKRDGGIGTNLTYTPQTKSLTGPVFAAKLNVLTGPVKTSFGYAVFEVTKATKAAYKPLAAIERRVQEEFVKEREATALKRYHERLEAKWRAVTHCRYGYVIALCSNYKP